MSEPVQQPAADLAQGDKVTYTGSFGAKVSGVIHEVKQLFDEVGTQVKAFIVHLEGVGRVLTSADALTKVEDPTPAATPAKKAAKTDG